MNLPEPEHNLSTSLVAYKIRVRLIDNAYARVGTLTRVNIAHPIQDQIEIMRQLIHDRLKTHEPKES